MSVTVAVVDGPTLELYRSSPRDGAEQWARILVGPQLTAQVAVAIATLLSEVTESTAVEVRESPPKPRTARELPTSPPGGERAVYAYLEAHPGQGPSAIAAGTGLGRVAVTSAIRRLAGKGAIGHGPAWRVTGPLVMYSRQGRPRGTFPRVNRAGVLEWMGGLPQPFPISRVMKHLSMNKKQTENRLHYYQRRGNIRRVGPGLWEVIT